MIPRYINLYVKSSIDEDQSSYWEKFINNHYLETKINPKINYWYTENARILSKYPLIEKYTQYYDEPINEGLLNNKISDKSFNIIEEISEALDESLPYPEELILFHGITGPNNIYSINELIEMPAFVSKSSIYVQAASFVKVDKKDQSPCCIFIIRYPPGSKQLYLRPISKFPDEDEYLSYPGEIFKVTDLLDISYLSYGYKMRGIILDYVGNMYDDISQIKNKIDSNIDKNYVIFRNCIQQYLDQQLYFEDANIYMSPGKGDIDSTHSANETFSKYIINGIIEQKTPEDINDRLYTLYASGKTNNIYLLPDLNLLTSTNIRFRSNTIAYDNNGRMSYTSRSDYYINYILGEISKIKINDEEIILKRIKINC